MLNHAAQEPVQGPATSRSMVGREHEQHLLEERLSLALAGHGGLALISGEAGIGKTTLTAWLADAASQVGALVLTGRCYDLSSTPPYGPWNEAIRGYVPVQGQPAIPAWFGDPDELAMIGSQRALLDEALRFFTDVAAAQPLLLVLEDLHWSDSASLEALRYIGRNIGGAAVLVAVTYRDDELTRHHELYPLLPLISRESDALRIHLRPLDLGAVGRLIDALYQLNDADRELLVTHVVERSEGNPFFSGEILSALEDEGVLHRNATSWSLRGLNQARVPLLLRQVLDARLARFTPETSAALRIAAVIGQEIPLDLWQSAAQLSDAELDEVISESVEGQVLQETGLEDGLRFHHALWREALYTSLILSKRRSLHRQLAEALIQKPGPDPDVVAHHFHAANDARASTWLLRAGVRAEQRYALRIAVRHYESAEAILEADTESTQARGWLLFHSGHLLRHIDRQRSLTSLETAGRIAAHTADRMLAAYSRSVHGLLLAFNNEIARGLIDMEAGAAAMTRVTPHDHERANSIIDSLFSDEVRRDQRMPLGSLIRKVQSHPDVNTLTGTYVLWLSLAGCFQQAIERGQDLVAHTERTIDDEMLVFDLCRDAYFGVSIAYDALGQPETANSWRQRVLSAYQALGHHVLVAMCYRFETRHILTYYTDRIADRQRASRLAKAAILKAVDALGTELPEIIHELPLLLIDGKWDVALEVATSVDRGTMVPVRAYDFMRAWEVLGGEMHQEEQAWDWIRWLLPGGPAHEPGNSIFLVSCLAQRVAAELSLDAADLTQAREWLEAHDRWMTWSGAELGRAEGCLLWARYSQLAGDNERARQYAELALACATDPRQPLALVAAHRFLGQLDASEGRYEAAAGHLAESISVAGVCEVPFERALSVLELARLRAATGNIDSALSLLNEVRAVCAGIGAVRTIERAGRLEAAIAAQRSKSDEHSILSRREKDVLSLIAEGKTDREIGAELFISHHTVMRHVSNILNKLGLESRTAAAAYAVRHNLV
jgi:DNA-binding CsgD family transcriptional regulator